MQSFILPPKAPLRRESCAPCEHQCKKLYIPCICRHLKTVALLITQFYNSYIDDFPHTILFILFLKTKGTKPVTQSQVWQRKMFFSQTLQSLQLRLQETLSTPPLLLSTLYVFHTFPFKMNAFVLLFVPPICHFIYSVLIIILDTLIPYFLKTGPHFPLQVMQFLVRPHFASPLLCLLLFVFFFIYYAQLTDSKLHKIIPQCHLL